MKVIAKWFVDFVGAVVALYGALILGMNSVTMFYLLNGTIAPGDLNKVFDVVPGFLHVAMMLTIGVLLLAGGYKGPKYLAAKIRKDQHKHQSEA